LEILKDKSTNNHINRLPPSDAVRKQKNKLEDLFSSILSQFKKYHPSGNLKSKNLGIFQSLKLRNLMGKILLISLKLNLTPNTLSCYGLIESSGRDLFIDMVVQKFILKNNLMPLLSRFLFMPRTRTGLPKKWNIFLQRTQLNPNGTYSNSAWPIHKPNQSYPHPTKTSQIQTKTNLAQRNLT